MNIRVEINLPELQAKLDQIDTATIVKPTVINDAKYNKRKKLGVG